MNSQYSQKVNNLIYLIIIIFIVTIDIFSKHWVINNIKMQETKEILPILSFVNIHNYGAAFSFLSNQAGWQRWFLSIVNMVTILIIAQRIIKSNSKEFMDNIPCCLIIAGAAGNLIDRVLYGFVIDFIDIQFNNSHFATFNIADSSIFIGLLTFTPTECESEKISKFI